MQIVALVSFNSFTFLIEIHIKKATVSRVRQIWKICQAKWTFLVKVSPPIQEVLKIL